MQTRLRQARWLAVLAMLWLIVTWILSMVFYTRGLDFIVIFLAGLGQLSVLIAWATFRGLPGWLVAGHGLVLLALAFGFVVVPGPPGGPLPGAPVLPAPWLVIGLVPAGVAMILAAILRRAPSGSLAH
jgi:hypothetical protein